MTSTTSRFTYLDQGIDPKGKELWVIDPQNAFVNSYTEHVVEPIAALIRDWCSHGGKVSASWFKSCGDDPWNEFMGWNTGGKENEALHPLVADAIAETGSHSFPKNSYSAVIGDTDLYWVRLTDWGDEIYLCGLDTEACVLATATDFFQHRFTRPVVFTDLCVSSRGPEYHQAGLMCLESLIGADQLVSVLSAPLIPAERR